MNYKIFTILFSALMISQFTDAQITPITTIVDSNYTTYKTSLDNQYLETLSSQPYALKRKISDSKTKAKYRDNYSFSTIFLQQTLSSTSYNALHNNRSKSTIIKVKYIIDETGNVVYSCSVSIPNIVTLSSSEIEAILTEALNHKFDYIAKPNDGSSFYFLVTYHLVV